MSAALRAELLGIYAGRATRRYGLSDINQLQHALQAAAHAEADGASPATIVAALLHDVGHMIHDLGEDPASAGIDDRHEALGADWLDTRVGPEIGQPVRLHVEAKRFLCGTEPGYFALLSEDSVRSLALQGGPMSSAEADAFRALPFSAEAVRLRRYDEAAKDPRARTPDFDHFLGYLRC